jgi:hypothetical protein
VEKETLKKWLEDVGFVTESIVDYHFGFHVAIKK